MSAADPSDEIRGRFSVVIGRLELIAHSTGPLDRDAILSAITLLEHEVSFVMAAVNRLPTKGGSRP
jgi:hypothetical protein